MTDAKIDWLPKPTLETLRKRAHFFALIRQYFASQAVLEVDTPILAPATVTDVHIHSFSTLWCALGSAPTPLFLQTSPEFAMKRLLAAGSGSIYQLGKVFRNEELGPWHQPEFTLLEWYRVEFSYHQLIEDVTALLHCLLGELPAQTRSYRGLFEELVGINPHQASSESLQACLLAHGQDQAFISSLTTKNACLDACMSLVIEPQLNNIPLLFIIDYPAQQAALSTLKSVGDDLVAQRFEVYLHGIECGNGYQELTDGAEQSRRFEADNAKRRENGLPVIAPDQRLLAALDQGLPFCSGVALGIDRIFAQHLHLALESALHTAT